MQVRRGSSIAYGMTPGGVMVQLHLEKPPDAEWTEMVEAIRRDTATLKGIVILAPSNEGPSATQRRQVSAVAAHYPPTFRGVALLTNSVVVRGGVTAISWLIPGGISTRAFALHALEPALDYLGLDGAERFDVRELIATLDPDRQVLRAR